VNLALRPCAGEPELADPAVTGQFAAQMAALAEEQQIPPWCGYIGWRDTEPLGFGGFVGKPDEAGVVEIGYLTFPAHEGQGVASAVAAGLVAIARGEGLSAVIAHTLAEENASTAVLRRNGFERDGEAQDPDEGTVWRWRIDFG
jgi:RimJ/RimL family protein N-acetyltransferase